MTQNRAEDFLRILMMEAFFVKMIQFLRQLATEAKIAGAVVKFKKFPRVAREQLQQSEKKCSTILSTECSQHSDQSWKVKSYIVNLENGTCTCAYFIHCNYACKHIFKALQVAGALVFFTMIRVVKLFLPEKDFESLPIQPNLVLSMQHLKEYKERASSRRAAYLVITDGTCENY
jgi:hypothetical protein